MELALCRIYPFPVTHLHLSYDLKVTPTGWTKKKNFKKSVEWRWRNRIWRRTIKRKAEEVGVWGEETRAQPCVKSIIENVKRCKEWQQWTGGAWQSSLSLRDYLRPAEALAFSPPHVLSVPNTQTHPHQHTRWNNLWFSPLHIWLSFVSVRFHLSLAPFPACVCCSRTRVAAGWACMWSMCMKMDLKGKCDARSALDPNVSFTAYPPFHLYSPLHELISLLLISFFLSVKMKVRFAAHIGHSDYWDD